MDYIPPGARGDGDDFFRRTADRMNAAAELCRKAGMKFAYRTHAFEFGGRAGLRPMDIFRERLDAKLVAFELGRVLGERGGDRSGGTAEALEGKGADDASAGQGEASAAPV